MWLARGLTVPGPREMFLESNRLSAGAVPRHPRDEGHHPGMLPVFEETGQLGQV